MKFSAQWVQPDGLLIELTADQLNRESVPEIRRDLFKTVRKKRVHKVVLDLSRVSRMDTAGVALLVELLDLLDRRNVKLELSGVNEGNRRMIRLARLDQVFTISNHAGDET